MLDEWILVEMLFTEPKEGLGPRKFNYRGLWEHSLKHYLTEKMEYTFRKKDRKNTSLMYYECHLGLNKETSQETTTATITKYGRRLNSFYFFAIVTYVLSLAIDIHKLLLFSPTGKKRWFQNAYSVCSFHWFQKTYCSYMASFWA